VPLEGAPGQHLVDAPEGGRHDRQAVGPAALAVQPVHRGRRIGVADQLDALPRELARARAAAEQALLLRARPQGVVDPLARGALARGQ
jgi:hypothetical protein